MARCHDTHVRPDHHIIGNVDPARIVHGAILLYEYIAPDADILAAGTVKRRDQRKLSSTLLPTRSLNTPRISSASSKVERLRAGVIAIARLTLATTAADSGVLLGIILVPFSFDIHYFPQATVGRVFRRKRGGTEIQTERATPYGIALREKQSSCTTIDYAIETFCTLPLRMQDVHTLTRLPAPFTTA